MLSEHLDHATTLLESSASLRQIAARWRERYPTLTAMVCDPLDMRDETPVRSAGQRALYLVAHNGHCWQVTQQPEQASGLILTEK